MIKACIETIDRLGKHERATTARNIQSENQLGIPHNLKIGYMYVKALCAFDAFFKFLHNEKIA